jgi:hypothetical protein
MGTIEDADKIRARIKCFEVARITQNTCVYESHPIWRDSVLWRTSERLYGRRYFYGASYHGPSQHWMSDEKAREILRAWKREAKEHGVRFGGLVVHEQYIRRSDR